MANRNVVQGDLFLYADDTDFLGYNSTGVAFKRPQKAYVTRAITIGGTIAGDPTANPTLNFATADGVVPAQTIGGQVSVTSGTQHLGYTAFLINAPLTTLPLIFSSSCTPGTTAGSGSMMFITNKANAAPAAADILFEWGYQASTAFVSGWQIRGDRGLYSVVAKNFGSSVPTAGTAGFLLENSTDATVGATVQNSDIIALGGGAWDTDGSAAGFRLGWQLVGISGATPLSYIRLVSSTRTGGPGAWSAWSAWTASGFDIISNGNTTTNNLTINGFCFGQRTSLGSGGTTTYTAGYLSINTTQATVGSTVQDSPAVIWTGHAWDTDGAVSDSHQFAVKVVPASGADTTATMYFGWRKGAGASIPGGNFATVATLTSGGTLTSNRYIANSSLSIDTGFTSYGDTGTIGSASATGDGFQEAIAGKALYLYHNGRTDAANNVIFGCTYKPGTATITNAATMRLWSWGWTATTAGPTYTYYEAASVRPNGDLYFTGGVYGSSGSFRSFDEVVTISYGSAYLETSGSIPAGAVVMSVSTRVLTVAANTATYSIGTAATPTLFTASLTDAAGTTALGTEGGFVAVSAATKVRITPDAAATDSNGTVRVVVTYYLPTAPTS